MLWVERCLASIPQVCSIVVVDNASTDGTVAYIQENYPQIHLLPQSTNLGFGQANNIGMRYALKQDVDYVFLLNQDAYLQENTLEILIATHIKSQEYGVLSPIHLNGQGTKLDEKFSQYLAYKNNPNFYSDFVLQKPRQDIYEVPFVNAAGWLLSKRTLQTIGGFDPIFFHYGEDDNYCQRVRYHGFKIGVVSSVFLSHDREERQREKVVYGSAQHFVKMERTFKMKYANINYNSVNELKKQKDKRKQQILKAYLKLQFKRAKILIKEVNLINSILPNIEKSRSRNKIKTNNYL